MTPAYKVIVPKIGPSEKIPLEIRYASTALFGLGLPNIYTLQGIEHIKLFISHISSGSKIGYSLTTLLEYINLEIGSDKLIFDLNFNKWHYLLHDCWLKVLWKFCAESNIQLKGSYKTLQKQRINDVCLMDTLVHDNQNFFTKADIIRINRCRIYLQVIFLSDLAISNGIRLDEKMLYGHRNDDRRSEIRWQCQQYPPEKDWKLFRDCVKLIWLKNSNPQVIQPPLGKWIRPPHQVWIFYCSSDYSVLYKRIEINCYRIFERWQYAHRDLRYISKSFRDSGRTCAHIPENSCRVSPIPDDGPSIVSIIDGDSQDVLPPPALDDDPLTSNVILDEDRDFFLQAIRDNNLVIVSDGSYSPRSHVGTAAVRIETRCKQTLGIGWTRVPGDKESMDAYRAELTGILLALKMIASVIGENWKDKGSIQVSCDNDKALQKGIEETWEKTIRCKHFDVLWEITSMIQMIPLTLIPVKVKGHSSELECATNQVANMNRWVDTVAGEYLEYCEQYDAQTRIQNFITNRWSVFVGGKKIVKDINSVINHHIHGKAFIQYLINTGKLRRQAFHLIDWKAMEVASKKLPLNERIWTTKLTCGFCAVGSMMKKRKLWDSSICKLCRSAPETPFHLFSCSASVEKKSDILLNIGKWMQEVGTAPEIQVLILETLLFMDDFASHLPDDASELLRMAASEQDSIGLNNFIVGKVSCQWAIVQEEYYRSIKKYKRRKGSTWASNLIQQICSFSHQIWKDRSEQVNKIVEREKNELECARLNQIIEDHFDKWYVQLRAEDRRLFDITENDLLAADLDTKCEWLDLIEVYCTRAREVQIPEVIRMQRFMEVWTSGRNRNLYR